MMGIGDIVFWPFALAFGGAMMIVGLALIIFWIWMIVDCAKRKFKNDAEKIIWIVVVAVCGWVGALVYFIVIKSINPHGLARR